MHSLRERPLTWLFWTATLCANLVGWLRFPEAEWFLIFLFAQLNVISCWGALGGAHRLGRAALVVLAPVVIAATVLSSQRAVDEAPFTLGITSVMAGLIFTVTLTIAALLRILPSQRRNLHRSRWQVSIVEMLGWMIVVAAASWALSVARLPPFDEIHAIRTTLLSALLPAASSALFLAPHPRLDRIALPMTAGLIAGFFATANRIDYLDQSDNLLFGSIFAFVAFWVLIVRLDEGPRPILGQLSRPSPQTDWSRFDEL